MKRPIPKPRFPGGPERTIRKRTFILMLLFGVLVFLPLLWKLFSLQILQ